MSGVMFPPQNFLQPCEGTSCTDVQCSQSASAKKICIEEFRMDYWEEQLEAQKEEQRLANALWRALQSRKRTQSVDLET